MEWATAADSPMRYIAASGERFRTMCESAMLQRIPAGTLVYRQGDVSSSFYVILRGSVELRHDVGSAVGSAGGAASAAPAAARDMGMAGSRLDASARAALGTKLGVCGEGDCLGDFELQTHRRRFASVIARGIVAGDGGPRAASASSGAADDGGDASEGGGHGDGRRATRIAMSTPARRGPSAGARGAGRNAAADAEWAAQLRGAEMRAFAGDGYATGAAVMEVLVVSLAVFEATVEPIFMRLMDATVRCVHTLQATPEFGDWTNDDLLLLAHFAREVRVPGGGALYRRGDPSNAMYLLTSGAVAVTTVFETAKTFDDNAVRMKPKAAPERPRTAVPAPVAAARRGHEKGKTNLVVVDLERITAPRCAARAAAQEH